MNVLFKAGASLPQCILVVMGAMAERTKELIAVADGYREIEQRWYEVLIDLNQRGMGIELLLVIGYGALGA